jgi:fructan beta-fructosidase
MKRQLTKILTLTCLVCFYSCDQASSQLKTENSSKFNETYRPQFHFTPEANWMNDPNGMVYLDGEYHLFYQYNPDSSVWGPMHWGHAISKDLVYWEHLPIALKPDSLGTIFSGSAVIDHHNTSGLGKPENPAMVAIYTYHDAEGERAGRIDYQTQGIAFSTDKGRTWQKYSGNPVLKNPGIRDFRDPKVSWVETGSGSGQWIMTLAVKDKISFYSSPNLIDWTHESDFNPEWAAYGGVWECPDLFPLRTADGQEKWVLFVSINPGGPQGGSATQYFIGDFDGKNFTTETSDIKWLDWGADNYAGVTWSNVPEADGRRLFIGWMSNWQYADVVPTENWRSATTLPRSLELIKDVNSYSLVSKPIKELVKLRTNTQDISGMEASLSQELVEFEFVVTNKDFRIEFQNEENDKLILESSGEHLVLDRGLSGIIDFSKDFSKIQTIPLGTVQAKKLQIYLDGSSIEVFINEGEIAITSLIFPNKPFNKIEMEGLGNGKAHYLKSIW